MDLWLHLEKERLSFMSKENNRTANSAPEALDILWQEGFFTTGRYFKDISEFLSKRGSNFPKPSLALALRQAPFLTRNGTRGLFKYIQKTPSSGSVVKNNQSAIFSAKLKKKLHKDFSIELSDLDLNYEKSGTCTAFLLRKILEKLIFLTFAKNGLDDKLKDAQGRYVGLETMINLASREKINGLHFLMPKTAENIQGIKFLGDTSAHNPLSNVNMKTIIPQMPYIVTAYEELASKL